MVRHAHHERSLLILLKPFELSLYDLKPFELSLYDEMN